MPSLVEIFKFRSCLISTSGPLGKGLFFYIDLNPHQPNMLCANFGWIGPVVVEKIFRFHQCIFGIMVIMSSWKGAGSFTWTNLNSFYPRMLCAKFGWNLTCSSGEEVENVKSLQTGGKKVRLINRRTTQHSNRIAHLSFQLRWANKVHNSGSETPLRWRIFLLLLLWPSFFHSSLLWIITQNEQHIWGTMLT